MGLTNRSNLRRTRLLNPLIQFVCNYTDFHEEAQVTIQDGDPVDAQGTPSCGGLAWYVKNGDKRAYDVAIALNSACTYPRTQRLNLRTPKVRFENWQDEFVCVLAHELRHIDQFVLGAFGKGQEMESEVDAETFAAAVLEAWQKLQRGVDTAAANP